MSKYHRCGAALGIAAALLLAGCAEKKPAPNLTPDQLSAVQAKWQRTWSGGWGGTCKSSIDVGDVTGNTAEVTYRYQNCGSSTDGSFVDYSADIEGDVLTVDVGIGTAVYTHQSENKLAGQFSFDRSGGSGARGSFTRAN